MNKKELNILKYAIKNNNELLISYVPNTSPRGLIFRARLILPLRIFSRLGKDYLLAYFSTGGSLSEKGAGFRLYFINNIKSIREVEKNKPINFNKTISKLEIYKLIKNIQ